MSDLPRARPPLPDDGTWRTTLRVAAFLISAMSACFAAGWLVLFL